MFDCLLDVLRIVIQAANDDEIFKTTCNEKLAILEETEISGAQVWSIVIARMIGSKTLPILRDAIPVTLRDAGS